MEIVSRGGWVSWDSRQMGPLGQHLMAEKKGHHPAKRVVWVALSSSIRSFKFGASASPAVISMGKQLWCRKATKSAIYPTVNVSALRRLKLKTEDL